MLGWVFLGLTSTKQGLMCLAQGHNAVPLARLKPATFQSQVKLSSTKPLRSCLCILMDFLIHIDTVNMGQLEFSKL